MAEEKNLNEESVASEENVNEADACAEGTKANEGTGKDSKKSKKKKKIDKPDKRDEEIADLKDRITRNLAEFENFRKRTEKEKAQMFDLGSKSIIEKLLPVVDNFERGLATLTEDDKEAPFAKGIDNTYKQLMKMLEDAGVTPIEAVGTEFTPDLHNAVMHVDDDNFGENVVCEEFQKGYMFHDSVVRHSMVKVAN